MNDEFELFENSNTKKIKSKMYNYIFNKNTGFTMRWGETVNDDPKFSPFGNEILDIEVSTICSGIPDAITGINIPCKHCYKSNTSIGKNMSFETFKKIFDVMPKTLSQIAFGIGDLSANKDLWKMMDYCRNNDVNPGVVPNVTINGADMTDELYYNLSEYCGAVAVSRYNPKDVCYNAVKELTDRDMKQINIHQLLSEETYGSCLELLEDIENDERLKKLNAVVFLSLKQKGRGQYFNRVSDDKFNNLMNLCLDREINFGLDSCGSGKFINVIKDRDNYKLLNSLIEPCESGLFSFYIDVDGFGHPCSFCENKLEDFKPINMLEVVDFCKDVWYNDSIVNWRNKLLKSNESGNYNCIVYNV